MNNETGASFKNINLQPSSISSFVRKINIIALIGFIPIAIIVYYFFTLEGETAGFFGAWILPLLLLLGLFVFSIWGFLILVSAVIAKRKNIYDSSGIKIYHIILAILALFSIPGYLTFESISMANYLEFERNMEAIIAGADVARTEDEISKYYYEKMKELDAYPGWQWNLQEKIIIKDNTPTKILRDIFAPFENEIEKRICFNGSAIKIVEALIENARTPDDILLQLLNLPLIPGHDIQTREKIATKAANALTKRGYSCKPYGSKQWEACIRYDSKEDGTYPIGEKFFKCTKK